MLLLVLYSHMVMSRHRSEYLMIIRRVRCGRVGSPRRSAGPASPSEAAEEELKVAGDLTPESRCMWASTALTGVTTGSRALSHGRHTTRAEAERCGLKDGEVHGLDR